MTDPPTGKRHPNESSSTFTAIDLFAGAGGATQGLIDAGFDVIGAVEYEPHAAASYRLNHPTTQLVERDIRQLPASELKRDLALSVGELALLKACPPCQGFSSLAEGRIDADDPRNDLVQHCVRFVRSLRPQMVLVENVPGLGRDRRSGALLTALRQLGYNSAEYYVNALSFGVPQNRKRLIILAIRGLRSRLPVELAASNFHNPRTVREAFSNLDREVAPFDPLNVHRQLPQRVLDRVRAIPVGGNRFDLPEDLQLECHRNLARQNKNGATGSYARLRWDEPAPTMTTRCTTPACGPFLHPEQHRPITLREAAAIQTFPADYQFVGSRGDIERQIGNAVPVRMASQIGKLLLAAAGAGTN